MGAVLGAHVAIFEHLRHIGHGFTFVMQSWSTDACKIATTGPAQSMSIAAGAADHLQYLQH
jgi:hypothetical protein